MEVNGVVFAVGAGLLVLAWIGGQRTAISRARTSRRFRIRHGIPR